MGLPGLGIDTAGMSAEFQGRGEPRAVTGIALLLKFIEPGGGTGFEPPLAALVSRWADQFLVRQDDGARLACIFSRADASRLRGRARRSTGEEPQVSECPVHTLTRACGPAGPFRVEYGGNITRSTTNQSHPKRKSGRFCGRVGRNR